MCCNGTANWKREVVPDHKFDFVDTRDYHSRACGTRLQYMWIYVLLAKSFMVYLSDIFTAITMLSTNGWSNAIFDRCKESGLTDCVVIDFTIGKWIFVGCIIFGYLLLVYEAWKAKKIIASRDISYAFTNVMANTYYSLRSYNHFCFFCQIENSTKKKDDFAFFIFFTFKGWKRLILADGPRQTINALTLYSFWLVNEGDLDKIEAYWNDQTLITQFLLVSIVFTTLVFLGSLLLLIIAALLYIPLLCYIQGNLKEYCCHKVDKRISELMKRKNRQRVAREAQLARKEAAGDFSHLKNKRGEMLRAPVPQPTLPNVSIDDDDDSTLAPPRAGGKSNYAASYAPSKDDQFYPSSNYPDYPPSLNGAAPEYPPPMPLYDQNPYLHGYPAGPYGQHQLPQEYADSMYDGHHGGQDHPEYNSTTQLANAAIPPAQNDVHGYAYQPSSHMHPGEGSDVGHGQAYGQAFGHGDRKRGSVESVGLAYDDVEPTMGPSPHRRSRSGGWPDEKAQGYLPQQSYHVANGGVNGYDDHSHGHAL